MDQDQQRDFAEEAANRALLRETDEAPLMHEEQEFAEEALKFYRLVASHTFADICASGTDTYEGAKMALMGAIRLAYSDVNESDIYDIAIDSGENLHYCADYVRRNGQYRLIGK